MKLSRPFFLIPFLFFFLTFNFILCSSLPLPYSPVINIAINCGSSRNLNASDGRLWSRDVAHDPIPLNHEGNSMKSNALHLPSWLDIIPYTTARISHSQFGYTFHAISPGPTFIRLHFLVASYHGFERAKPLFIVKAGPYTLINNFSASLTKDCSKFKYCVKEFSLIPSSSHDTYAFVNGIEIISMPQSLYYSRDDEVGAPVVGQKYRFYIDNGTAMEMVQRLNIGGRFISPVEDSGLFRAWFPDTKFLLQTETISISTSKVVKYTKLPSYIAPMEVYRTARSISPHNGSLSWKFAVDLGFRYLVRLHFCKLNYEEGVSGDKGFNIFIKDEIAEAYANVLKWSGGDRVAIYRDYVVVMEGDKVEGKRDLFLTLRPNDESTYPYRLAVLNGLEIFKLSNPDNTLAGPNFVADQTYKSLKVNKVLLLFIVVNVIGLIIIIFSVVSHVFRHWNKEKSRKIEAPQQFSEGLSRCFSIAEIRSATDNFNENLIIGIGGFGKVYKGVIDNGATTVAIKRQNEKSSQGDIEFRAEIEMLSKLRHVHLVSLIGYCKDGEEMILIYDYMACGTLADHLYRRSLGDHIYKSHQNPPPLSWRERLEICIGAARGLEYLHTGLHRKIIHRDVKATNILLDENRVAKISDFGLSRLGPTSLSLSEVTTNLVKGTPGYLDPEYYRSGRPTVKSDVYSFGVVLFEVLSGRRAVDMRFKEEERKSLAKWAPRCVKEERIDQITDPFLHGKITSQCLAAFIEIASRCIENQRQKRPTMAEVVRKLESVLAEQEKWNTGITHEININVIDKNVPSDDDQIEDERSPLCPKEIEMAKVSGPPPEMHGIARTWPGLFFQYGASSSSKKLKERITILIQKMGFNRKGSDIDVKRRVRHSSPTKS